VNASLQYLGIVFAVVFGALIFDDPVTAQALGGMALIVVAGLAATSLREHQQHDAPETRTPPNDT
jgi:drug/metabolite transporter (DMT)-like permease